MRYWRFNTCPTNKIKSHTKACLQHNEAQPFTSGHSRELISGRKDKYLHQQSTFMPPDLVLKQTRVRDRWREQRSSSLSMCSSWLFWVIIEQLNSDVCACFSPQCTLWTFVASVYLVTKQWCEICKHAAHIFP